MQKFKPIQTSWVARINIQTAILFFIAIATIGASLFYLRANQTNPSLSQGGSFAIKSSRQSITEAGTEATAALDSDDANVGSGTNRDGRSDIQIAVQDPSQLDEFAKRSAGASSKGTATEFQNPRIKMSFIEIPQDQLNQLLGDVQNEGLLQRENEYFKGIINKVTDLSKYSFKTLKQDVKEIKPNQIEAFFYGQTSRESSQFLGLQINLEKKSTATEDSTWTLTANKVLPTDKQSELHEFQIQTNSALFISARAWIDGLQNERALSDIAPFQIFKSPDFINQRSEILILLEFY